MQWRDRFSAPVATMLLLSSGDTRSRTYMHNQVSLTRLDLTIKWIFFSHSTKLL